MNEHLQFFYRWFWLSLTIAAGLGVLLFVATCRRDAWLRYLSAEARFWIRLGIPEKLAEASRRFGASRALVYILWVEIALLLLLSLLNGFSYLHWEHRLPTKTTTEARSFYEAGANQSKIGDYAGAITNFTRAIEACSNYAEAYSFRAKAKYNLEDFRGAIADANKAIELKPEWEPAYNVRGFSKYALKDYADSISDFKKSVNLDSTYAPAYYGRGLAEANLTNYPAAVEDFTKALKLKKDYASAYYYRGLIEQGLTNYTAAIVDFGKAIESHTNFPDAFNMRGLPDSRKLIIIAGWPSSI
jgi:tetratricopeptide (TPR) repeat protein